MKLVLDWLREYVKFEESADQLADLYTSLGFETTTLSKEVIDLEITPNRGDCLSVLGLAREYAAKANKPLSLKRCQYDFSEKPKSIKIKADPSLVHRYTAAIIRDVRIKESPHYIKEKLLAYGIKPHNNLVDITNLIMIETGQPLHGFDLAKIKGKSIVVRAARKGEQLEILSGEIIKLSGENAVIADKQRVIDLLGIMGGANSAISESTKDILLQAAALEPQVIRKSTKSSKVSSEASYRYERSVDFEGSRYGISLATKLIEQEAQGSVEEIFDLIIKPLRTRSLGLRYRKVSELLGTRLDNKLIRNYLIRLGFVLVKDSGSDVVVKVPSHRMADILFEEDLVEEVGRLHGYNRLSRKLVAKTSPKINVSYQIKRAIRVSLSVAGFQEILSYSLVDPKHAQALGIGESELRKLANPLSPENSVLRPSLVIGALKSIQKNAWWPQIKIFEIGRVFTKQGEQKNLLVAASPGFSKTDYELLNNLNVVRFEPTHQLSKLLKLRRPVELVETSLQFYAKAAKVKPPAATRPALPDITYRQISAFPPLVRDIAIIVAKDIAPENIIRTTKSLDQRILIVELFDEFISPKFGKNKKSLAFRLVFDNPQKTMTDDEANQLMEKIVRELKDKLSASMR